MPKIGHEQITKDNPVLHYWLSPLNVSSVSIHCLKRSCT